MWGLPERRGLSTVTEPDDGPHPAVAFDAFYRQHHRDAVRWAAALVGQRHVAEELAHDALVRTAARLEHLDNPGAYLRRSVVNACRSWHRSHGREAARLSKVVRSDQALSTGAAPLSDTSVEVLDVLARLPYRQRAAVVLRFWADWPDDHIAEALGCRPASVRVLVHRGLATLREQLTEETPR